MKQLEIIWMLLTIFAVNVNCDNYIKVKPNVNITVSSSGYPNFTTKSDTWLIGNEQLGGAIYIKCSIQFKRNLRDCSTNSIVFSDEIAEEICTNVKIYTFHSKYNSVKIRLHLTNNAEAKFSCVAKAMASGRVDAPNLIPLKQIPNEIILKKYTRNHYINGNITSGMDYKFSFKCESKCSIGLKCRLAVTSSIQYEVPCDGFKLTLQSKAKTGWQCHTSKHYTFLSPTESLNVYITSSKQGTVKGTIDCEIMALDRISHSQYKRLPPDPDYDSSELGARTLVSKKKPSCDCGWTNKQSSRIIFGRYTGKHEFPWSVSLQYKSSKFHFCGGSIITASHILTAAHCIGSKKPSAIMVVMGTNHRTDSTISADVKEIIQHNYDTSNHEHDIAILVLKSKITFTEKVGPVCLPTVPHNKLVNQHVTAMGWGRIHKNEEGKMDVTLQKKTTLRVIDIESCSLDWNYHWDIPDPKVICTWGGNTDICIGDSGGPVVWHDPEVNRFTLVGMPALCDSCVLRLPSAHTNVHHYFNWIQQSIANSTEPKEKTCQKID